MINLDTILADNNSIELGPTTLAALESITVVATDLDIRDLAFATDKVDVTGSEVSLDSATLAALENITVSATDLDIRNLVFATDKVDVSGSSIEVAEAGYDTWQVTNVSVTTTESTVSALANRLRIEIQNLGSQDIYIRQSTGVSSTNGLKIPKGSSYEQALDAGAAIYMVSASGSSDVRIAQYAA